MAKRRALILIFRDIDVKRILELIDSYEEIEDWHAEFVNCIFLCSRIDARALAPRLIKDLKLIVGPPRKVTGTLLVTEYKSDDAQGLLSMAGWTVLNHLDD